MACDDAGARNPWQRFATGAPALAEAVAGRFAANLHHVLATLDPHGAPRVSGLEAPIRDGHLWLGMMPGSVKRADLARDPRFALHAAPIDVEMVEGDAKLAGVAIDVSDDEGMVALFLSGTDFDPTAGPGGGMALFVADLTRVTLTKVAGDVLEVRTWTPEAGVTVHEVR